MARGGNKWQEEEEVRKIVCDFLKNYKGSTIFIVSRGCCDTTCSLMEEIRKRSKLATSLKCFGNLKSASDDERKNVSDFIVKAGHDILLVNEGSVEVVPKDKIKKLLKKK